MRTDRIGQPSMKLINTLCIFQCSHISQDRLEEIQVVLWIYDILTTTPPTTDLMPSFMCMLMMKRNTKPADPWQVQSQGNPNQTTPKTPPPPLPPQFEMLPCTQSVISQPRTPYTMGKKKNYHSAQMQGPRLVNVYNTKCRQQKTKTRQISTRMQSKHDSEPSSQCKTGGHVREMKSGLNKESHRKAFEGYHTGFAMAESGSLREASEIVVLDIWILQS